MPGRVELAGNRKSPTVSTSVRRAGGVVEELAARPALAGLLQSFSRERRWIDEQHLAICRIPAPTFSEQQRAAFLHEQFTRLGWSSRLDRAGNVVAQHSSAARSAPVVALTAHLDTVLAPRRPEEIRVESNGRFTGPGVADNGAGLAALLAMARAFSAYPQAAPAAQLVLAANVGEEGEGNLSGMRYLCQQPPLAGRLHTVIVLDGPDVTHITARALACRRFDVTLAGAGGHSWSDRGMANPVHALARAITWFCDERLQGPGPEPPGSWNFGVIEGGSTVNAIPASCRVKVDLRSESAADLESLADSLASAVERAAKFENENARSGRVSVRVKETGSRPAGALPDDSPLLESIRAVDCFLGIRSEPDCASTDANLPLSMGLPALSIGAGGQGGGAHTPAEWYSPEGRELGLRRVALLAAMLLDRLVRP